MSKTAILLVTLSHFCYIVVFTCLLLWGSSDGATDNLEIPPNAGCACPGDVLTYTCTNTGGGNTIWRGSAFDCESSSDEIILRHSQFAGAGTRGSCTGETLRAQSLGVESNCYMSQLDATVSTSISGQSIGCFHNSNAGTRTIGESTVNVISATNPYPAPTNIGLAAEITEGQVTFNWTAVCSTAQFLVESDCGVCPSSTNTSTVTCTNFQLPTDSNDTMCSFMVNGRACDMTSDLITTVVLRVPDAPTVGIIPTYLNASRMLTRVEFTPEIQSEVISGDISGPVLNYFPAFLSSSGLFRISSQSGQGPFNYTVPPGLCSPATTISVNVSAANRVGRGFPSDTQTIGCVNNFVRVNFYPQNSTVTCMFIDEMDATEKFCRIDYGLYNKEQTDSSQGRSTNDNPNTVSLNLMNLLNERYQYVVLVSSNMTTVRVEGDFTIDAPKRNNTVEVVVAVVVVGLVLVGAVVLAITFGVCTCRWRRNKGRKRRPGDVPLVPKDLQKALNLKEIKNQDLNVYKVDNDCALGEFVESKLPLGAKYQRSCAYYELTNKKEDVNERQEIILQEKKSEKLYTPKVDSSVLRSEGLLGEGVSRPNYSDEYRVFVQSMGSGKRHLQANTYIIYEEPEHIAHEQAGTPAGNSVVKHHYEDKKQSLMSPVPKDYFIPVLIPVDTNGMTLNEFCDKHGLRKKRLNIFLEVSQMLQKPIDVRDVLLMDEDTETLFSDPVALSKVKENKEKEIDPKWRVLVLSKYKDYSKVILEPGMWVAYENPKLVYGKYRALQVQEDNVRMSDFITKKIRTFERSKAFYEFKEGDKEDLLCCRKAIRITEKKVQQLMEKDQSPGQFTTWGLEATIATFYAFLPDAPGVRIRSPASEKWRYFIQSTSQGARCLKKGTVVLYNFGAYDAKKDGAPINAEPEEEVDDGSEVRVEGSPSTVEKTTPQLTPAANGQKKRDNI